MESFAKGRWVTALAPIALVLCVIPAAPSHAGPRIKISTVQSYADEFYGENDGPAFLIISVTPDFDKPYISNLNSAKSSMDESGSQVILVNVGKFIAGDDISTTRFESPPEVNVVLPTMEDGITPISIDGNQATIVGSFRTFNPQDQTAHMMTPYVQQDDPLNPDHIPVQVQEAYFKASRLFTDAQRAGLLPQFPTTAELAYFIYENQDGAGAEFQDILEGVFQPADLANPPPPPPSDPPREAEVMRMNLEDSYSILEAEGDLFPHQPADSLFHYRFKFNKNGGAITFDMIRPVVVDLKPNNDTNSVNLGSEGVIPVAILTETRVGGVVAFDAKEIDTSSLDNIYAVAVDELGFVRTAVSVDKFTYEDVDYDDDIDLLVHFRTAELREVVQYEVNWYIQVRANLTGNSTVVEGRSHMRLVPPNK